MHELMVRPHAMESAFVVVMWQNRRSRPVI